MSPVPAGTTRYIASGQVRGACGHRHRTLAGAARCLERDLRLCRRTDGGTYSDRTVLAVTTYPGGAWREVPLWHDSEGWYDASGQPWPVA